MSSRLNPMESASDDSRFHQVVYVRGSGHNLLMVEPIRPFPARPSAAMMKLVPRLLSDDRRPSLTFLSKEEAKSFADPPASPPRFRLHKDLPPERPYSSFL